MEMFGQLTREPIIVQRYLDDVRGGDKRIILIDGEPVGAINRVPDESDARSNMHVGGKALETIMTDRERRSATASARPCANAASPSSAST
jgi:glutathione synthase